MATYIQAKQQQALGNVYHPVLHEWMQQQLEYIFYFVPDRQWHGELYAEIVKMKPGRKAMKYLAEVIPAALKLSKQPAKGKAQMEAQVGELTKKFIEQLEAKQRE